MAKPIGMASGSIVGNAYHLLTRYTGEMGSDMLSDLFSTKQS